MWIENARAFIEHINDVETLIWRGKMAWVSSSDKKNEYSTRFLFVTLISFGVFNAADFQI